MVAEEEQLRLEVEHALHGVDEGERVAQAVAPDRYQIGKVTE